MKRAMTLAVVFAGLMAVPSFQADTWDKKTKITFSGPFQIPAPNLSAKVMTLPPGSYVFRLASSDSNRHIVQVTNPRGDKVYSTILAIADYRLNASSKTTMYFTERAAGAPVAIKSWFYPGDNFGQRFVYPKAQAVQIAAATNQPVPSHNVEVVEKIRYVEVPVYIQTPEKKEVAYTPTVFEKHDSTDSHGEDGEAVKEAPASSLPKTASPIYLLGLMGLTLTAISFTVRRVAARL